MSETSNSIAEQIESFEEKYESRFWQVSDRILLILIEFVLLVFLFKEQFVNKTSPSIGSKYSTSIN